MRVRLVLGMLISGVLMTMGSATPVVLARGVEPTPVHLLASDFSFVIDRTILPAGQFAFDVLNLSSEYRHEVWIYPIDERDSPAFQEMLTLKRTGQRADELDFIQRVVGRSGEVAAGEAMAFPAAIPPGVYEIACLAREGTGDVRTLHYDEGMYAVIAVRP